MTAAPPRQTKIAFAPSSTTRTTERLLPEMERISVATLGSRLMNNSGMSFLASLSMIMPLTPRSHSVWPEHITGQEGERGREGGRQTDRGRRKERDRESERVCVFVFVILHIKKKTLGDRQALEFGRIFPTAIMRPTCFFNSADNLTSSACFGDLIVLSGISKSLVYPI